MTAPDHDITLSESITAMGTAKTWPEFDQICRNLEARHRVEGISAADLAAYENIKSQHVARVARRVLV